MDNDAYGGSADLAGAMGEGSFSSAGSDYGYSSGDYGQNVFGALDRALAGEDLDKSSLETLAAAGLGKVDISPTQNVEQALAARNVHNVLNYTVPALVSMVPGYGTVSALGKGIANIHGLMTGRLTPAEVVPGLAAGLISAKTGIPSGILEGLFEGNLGKAAGSGVQAGITSGLGPLGGLAFNLSGAGSAVNRGVSDAVSGVTGGARAGSSGILGAGPTAPSTSTSPTGNVYGDTGASNATEALLAELAPKQEEPETPSFTQNLLAGRYGPIAQYEFGA